MTSGNRNIFGVLFGDTDEYIDEIDYNSIIDIDIDQYTNYAIANDTATFFQEGGMYFFHIGFEYGEENKYGDVARGMVTISCDEKLNVTDVDSERYGYS